MKHTKLKVFGLLLTLIMVFSLLPPGALFALAEEPADEIVSVDLSLKLPVPGPVEAEPGAPVPAELAVGEESGVVITGAFWYGSEGENPESFEAGKAYYAEIRLAPEEGRRFGEDPAVTVDSAAVSEILPEEDGSLLIRTEPVVLEEEEPPAPTASLWVGGVPVTEENRNDILGDGGSASFDPGTGTLTLNQPAIAGTEEDSGAQILAEGFDLTILGKAELALPGALSGIFVRGGSLTLEGEFTVEGAGVALYADKDLSFSDGKISVAVSSADQFAVRAGEKVLVKKAELSAVGTRGGILAGDAFLLEEGVVKATATGVDCDEELFKAGIEAGGVIEIKGGDLTAKGPDFGLCGQTDISFSGGIVAAEGAQAGILSREGTLRILDKTKRVTADSGSEAAAIRAGEIALGEYLVIREPEGGALHEDKTQFAREDGSAPVEHVVIETTLPTVYTVSFETYGGPEVPSQTVAEGETALAPPDPVLEGFLFCGWFLDPAEDGEHPFDFSSPITGDLTLRALWACTVEARVQDTLGHPDVGGTVSMGTEGYQVTRSVSFWRDGGPYRIDCRADEGYRFDHWEDDLGNTLPETEPGFSFRVQDGPKVFVAVFQPDPLPRYTVTLDGNGGTPEIQTLTSNEYGFLDPEEFRAAAEELTREGYTLSGWSLMPGGKLLDVDTYVFTEDTTLYASWSIRYFTVSFEANGGSETAAQYVPYGSCAFEPDDPVKANYSFNGWYSDEGLTQAFDFNTPITADTVLYANWEQLAKYTVISGGGSIYGKTSGKELEITVRRTPKDGECFQHFTGVKVDNGDLTPDVDYTAREGSTIVTLKPAFLSQLNSGSHIITITFDDGKATTGLTVKAGNSGGSKRGGGGNGNGGGGTNPQTGDVSSPLLWTAVLICSGTALGAVLVTGRKLRRADRR